MKTAVTLLILGLVIISSPVFACGEKECGAKGEHCKGVKKSSSGHSHKTVESAAETNDHKKAETPVETKAEEK